MSQGKPQTPEPGAKGGKIPINGAKDLDVEPRKEEQSFFSTFFSAAKTGQPKKKGPQPMEAPPQIIRPQAALNERETMETEVISASLLFFSHYART